MSAAKGIDYLNRDFQSYLRDDMTSLLQDPDASAISNLMRKFGETGTEGWERDTPEYFLIYLFTEIGITPHNILHGRNSVSILTLLQVVIQDLKRQRFDRWQPKQTVRLVQQYLTCADELKTLNLLFAKRLGFFQRLEQDVLAQDEEYSHDPSATGDEYCEPAIERVRWAIDNLERQVKDTERLLADLLQAMTSVR